MTYYKSSKISMVLGWMFLLIGSMFLILVVFLVADADTVKVITNGVTTIEPMSITLKLIFMFIPSTGILIGIKSINDAIKEQRFARSDLAEFRYTLSAYKIVKCKGTNPNRYYNKHSIICKENLTYDEVISKDIEFDVSSFSWSFMKDVKNRLLHAEKIDIKIAFANAYKIKVMAVTLRKDNSDYKSV